MGSDEEVHMKQMMFLAHLRTASSVKTSNTISYYTVIDVVKNINYAILIQDLD